MEKLLLSLMMKLFHISNRNLQDPIVFHAMTRIRFSFLKKMGGISQRKLLRKLEEEEEKKHVQLLHKKALGVNPYMGLCIRMSSPYLLYL